MWPVSDDRSVGFHWGGNSIPITLIVRGSHFSDAPLFVTSGSLRRSK